MDMIAGDDNGDSNDDVQGKEGEGEVGDSMNHLLMMRSEMGMLFCTDKSIHSCSCRL